MLASSRFLRLLAVLSLAVPALAATPITGKVTNGTNGKPSAGDDVTLIRLAQGMQESTHTKTDARGHYKLDVPDDGLHLVRVTHDKANYFGAAPAGTTAVDVTVYDSAPKVEGVSTEAVVLRMQTDAAGSQLKVVENFFVNNDSKPAMTQFSQEPFDFYLPDGAVVEGSAALAPGGMPVQAQPVPLSEKGKFTFLFPIRPGETRFQVSYHVPYSGSFKFDPRPSGPTDTIALMMPKAMTFTAAPSTPYSAINDEVNAQTYVARNLQPGQPVAFTLTGKGELPRDTTDQSGNPAAAGQSGDQQAAGGDVAATDRTAPGKGLDNPLDPNGDRNPLGKYQWWILAGLFILMAAAAAFLLRKPGTTTAAATEPVSSLTSPSSEKVGNAALLNVLKEEMFALETEKLQGKITDADYASTKSALELILTRALKRGA